MTDPITNGSAENIDGSNYADDASESEPSSEMSSGPEASATEEPTTGEEGSVDNPGGETTDALEAPPQASASADSEEADGGDAQSVVDPDSEEESDGEGPPEDDRDHTVPGARLDAEALEEIDIDPRLMKAAESMIFAADEPVPPHRIGEIFAEVTGRMQPDIATVEAHVRALNQEYQSTGRPLVIHEWSGGYRITTRPEMSPFVKALVVGEQETSLSRSLLETLAVLAYRQPVTRPEVDFVRGVNSDYAIRKLLDLGLADVKGRSESLGRPLLYGTTDRFLEQFGLNTLEDLPTLREIEDLLDDPNFDEERSQLLQLDTEKEITDRETAKEVLSEAREMVQKGELDADDFIDNDDAPEEGRSSEGGAEPETKTPKDDGERADENVSGDGVAPDVESSSGDSESDRTSEEE